MYQTVWSLIIGEENLECRHEEKNEEDEFAIAVYWCLLVFIGVY